MDNEIKKLKEEFEQFKKTVRPVSDFDKYRYDVMEYLCSKLEKYNISQSDLLEIVECLTYKAVIEINNEVRANCRLCNRERIAKINRTRNEGVNNG